MARVKPVEIFDHFNPQMRAALEDALGKALPPNVEIDRRQLYLDFRRALNGRVKMWENIPNSAVDAE